MKTELVLIEKNHEEFITSGVRYYVEKIRHYLSLEITTITVPSQVRKMSVEEQKRSEAEMIVKKMDAAAYRILLDEKGNLMDSSAFASMLNRRMGQSVKKIQFFIGGPYGVHDSIKKEFHYHLSLSPMTFSHQIIRIIFLEQLYRALTILKGEKYHHA